MPGISDLQDDPRVNVRQRPTPAGVDGVQHEDGQLMVHDGAGQGGISSLPMQVEIAGQLHILSYLTPEEQERLRGDGGGIAADGGQVFGPGGVPAFPDPSATGNGDGSTNGGVGGDGGTGNAGENNGPSGTSADPNSSPNSVAGRAEVGTDPRGGIAAGNRADPGIQETEHFGAVPTTGSFATDVAGIGYGVDQGLAADPLGGIVGLATRATGFGIAQDIGTAGIAAAERAGVSAAPSSTNDKDGPGGTTGGTEWVDGSAAGYTPGAISRLALDVASGAAIASESAGSTPGSTTSSPANEYTGPDLSGTYFGREGDWHGGVFGSPAPNDAPEWYAARGYDVQKVGFDTWQVVKSRGTSGGSGGSDDTADAPDYPDDWSEADFLAGNPDVAAAVEQGLYPSGYSFDQSFRRFTGGTGWDDRADTPGQSLDPRYSSDVYDQFLARNGRRQPVDVNTYYYG